MEFERISAQAGSNWYLGGRVPSTRPARVLLVDDDADFLVIWRLLLAHDGRFSAPTEARGGEEALRLLRSSGRPDLVLSDVRMGAVSGFDVLADVQEQHPGTPVVLTSSAEGTRLEALTRGASLFLAKSQTTMDLFPETIWRVLNADPANSRGENHSVPPTVRQLHG